MSTALVEPFPQVGVLMMRAYADLARVEQAKNLDEVLDLGPLELLPRPWDVTSCRDAGLRREVEWLTQWSGDQHPARVAADSLSWMLATASALVHEIGCPLTARRAGLAVTSEPLEDWHRHGLPQFLDRIHTRTRGICEDKEIAQRYPHRLIPAAPWTPGRNCSPRTRHLAAAAPSAGSVGLVDGLIDPTTGEVLP